MKKLKIDMDSYLDIDIQLISARIMESIQKHCDKHKITRQQMANLMGTSKVYMTQLYTGSKVLSVKQMTKFEAALDIKFEFNIKKNK